MRVLETAPPPLWTSPLQSHLATFDGAFPATTTAKRSGPCRNLHSCLLGAAGTLSASLPWPLIFALALAPAGYRLMIESLVSFGKPPWSIDILRSYTLLVLSVTSFVAVPALLMVQIRISHGDIEARALAAASALALAFWGIVAWQAGTWLVLTTPHIAYQTRQAIEHLSKPWIELSPDGTDVAVRTDYEWGVSEQVKAFVRAHPGVRSLTLSGPGGVSWEGTRLALFVMERGLDTRVVDPCHSACAGVFLAGRRRILRVDGKEGLLGLHAPHLKDRNGRSRIWDVFGFEVLRRAGANETFLWRIWNTPPDTVWRPSPAELAQGGIPVEVDHVAPRATGLRSGPGAGR
jgi:hypothetical protein